jgi:hypothetical protein
MNAAVAREAIFPGAAEMAEDAADIALERFSDQLHSVYLSGPAARGRPGGAAIFILLRLGAAADTIGKSAFEAWEAAAAAHLRRRHAQIGRIALSVLLWKDVFGSDGAFSPARFRLAVNSVCIAGRSMTRMLPPQTLDPAVMNADIVAFRGRMLTAVGRVNAAAGAERIRAAAKDAGSAVLSAGFALILDREQSYTEDLDLRRDLIALNFPARTRDIRDAYAMAIRPPDDAMTVLKFIDASCKWLTPKTDAWLNAHNPRRQERLPA